MTTRLVLATKNQDKFREIQAKLHPLPVVTLSLAEFPFVGEVEEDQPDLYGNAIKKATEVSAQTG
ncbi:MAG: non-canonical purine NTP pyrophosphatase, partial [bacterium]|nr:non-canonical purine NTP pyrophosphatase [bacterium]